MTPLVDAYRLPHLVGSIELATLSDDVRLPRTYAGFETQSLFRMHLLPYLLPLKSERALAFEVAERPQLQAAVGLLNADIPSRATLWHFRRRNRVAFQRLMVRALALLAFRAAVQGLQVPFLRVETDGLRGRRRGVSRDVVVDRESGTEVRVFASSHGSIKRPATDPPRLPGFEIERSTRVIPVKALLHQALDLPIEVAWREGKRTVRRYLVQPPWLDSPYEKQDLGDYFGRDRRTPYTACNVIILRTVRGSDEVLLCRRLRGTGAGTYSLPGGKKYPNESVVACVRRELREEIGIEYRSGRLVSRRTTRKRGFPPVTSIGVLATEWRGTPKRREHLAHSKWSWFSLANLPKPLFFPTRLALDDYMGNLFPDLEWDEVDDDLPLPLWRS